MLGARSRRPSDALVGGALPPEVGEATGEGGGLVLEGRRPLRYQVHLPGGLAAAVLVRGVAPPQALDQGGCWDLPPVHVLLPLLLLDLQGEPGPQDARGEREEGDPADGTE